jgi:hypothetical protein
VSATDLETPVPSCEAVAAGVVGRSELAAATRGATAERRRMREALDRYERERPAGGDAAGVLRYWRSRIGAA